MAGGVPEPLLRLERSHGAHCLIPDAGRLFAVVRVQGGDSAAFLMLLPSCPVYASQEGCG